VAVPVGSDAHAFATVISNELSTLYGSSISAPADITYNTVGGFDNNTLFAKKSQQSTLKGGIFFYNTTTTTGGGQTLYSYNTLTNTRSPTSYFFLSTLAAQTILNNLLSSNIQIQVTNHPLPRTY